MCNQSQLSKAPMSLNTRILVFLGLLSITHHAAPPRAPELDVLEQLAGTWRATVVNGDEEPKVSTITRSWSENGTTLVERSLRNQDVGFAAWTYNPADRSYRAVLLTPYFAGHWRATWDEASRTFTNYYMNSFGQTGLGRHRFIDADHAEWTMVLQTPEGEISLRGKQERITKAAGVAAGRKVALRNLRHFDGTWTSTLRNTQNGESHSLTSNTRWADAGSNFQVTGEQGLNDSEKHSAITYDPTARHFRGVFIEPGGAGFFDAWWTENNKQLKQVFTIFPSIDAVGDTAPPKPHFKHGINGWSTRSVIADGIHRTTLTVRLGEEEIWSGTGALKRDDVDLKSWPLRVADGKGLVPLLETKNGVTIDMKTGDEAARVFVAGDRIRLVERPELGLSVSAEQDVLSFREASSPFQVNPEGSISPARSPNMALGWQGKLKLVRRSEPSVLIFTEAPRPKPPPTNYEYRLEGGKLAFVSPRDTREVTVHPSSAFDMPDLRITAIAPWDSLCWVGTSSGLFRFDAQARSWSRFAIDRTELNAKVDSLTIDGDSLQVSYGANSARFDLKTRTWLSAAVEAPAEQEPDTAAVPVDSEPPLSVLQQSKGALMLLVGLLVTTCVVQLTRKKTT
jgi:hypothetical protein